MAIVLAAPLASQGRRGGAPLLVDRGLVFEVPAEPAQRGVPVRMFESPRLDRFLRKAQDFLERDDFASAIKVLQDVLEGRVRPGAIEAEGVAPSPAASETDKTAKETVEDDPKNAVFSSDGRLYRPVRRLCHEMLATLPLAGRRLYREMYEVQAGAMFAAAYAARDASGLEEVYDQFFLTPSGARAMYAAGDMQMSRGRFRAAIQLYRDLLTVYPSELRDQAGISDLYLEAKTALCLSFAGDLGFARERLAELTAHHSGETIRLLGELMSIDEFASSKWFLADRPFPRSAPAQRSRPSSFFAEGVVPVWQYVFTDPEPYRRPTASRRQSFVIAQQTSPAAPRHNQYKPGTSVALDDSRVLLMDNFRVQVHDRASGMLQMYGDGAETAPSPRQGQPRVRVPVYDFATQRVVHDDDRYFCILGPPRRLNPSSMQAVLRNQLVAYDRRTLTRLWSTADQSSSGARATFLAAPTLFGSRVLVPVLEQGSYALQCRDAATGRLVYQVMIHGGGSEYARAPAVPAVVRSGTAYVLTNAGGLAAIDAYTGVLRWVRRYERHHPLRPAEPRAGGAGKTSRPMQQYYREVSLSEFVPADLLILDGRVLMTPADGSVMICVDGASGELLWVVTRPSDRNVYLVGHNSRHVYLCGDARLTCIDYSSGVRMWDRAVPERGWNGRGLVTEDEVWLPGTGGIYVLAADGSNDWRTLDLPEFSLGREPLRGPYNLVVDGAYLVASREGGVQAYASLSGLHELADAATDPETRARLLVQTGELGAAIEVLGALAQAPDQPAGRRDQLGRRILAVGGDLVIDLANRGKAAAAIAQLDRMRGWLPDGDLVVRWQLLRVEVFTALDDLEHAQREQDILYEMMVGKRMPASVQQSRR